MFIYRIYNIDTNESYIGQTTKNVEYRFKEHIREAKRALRCEMRNFPYFHRMLLYYGPEFFNVELLEEVDNHLADEREIYWIDYFNSYYEGYNSTKGGQNRPMAELNAEGNAKWRLNVPNKIKNKDNNGMNIQEVIAKGLYDPKGNNNAGKPVAQYDKQGNLLNIYPSAKIAGELTNTSIAGIRSNCNGTLKSSGGFIWKWTDKKIQNSLSQK